LSFKFPIFYMFSTAERSVPSVYMDDVTRALCGKDSVIIPRLPAIWSCVNLPICSNIYFIFFLQSLDMKHVPKGNTSKKVVGGG
jgi:hypothetical protein